MVQFVAIGETLVNFFHQDIKEQHAQPHLYSLGLYDCCLLHFFEKCPFKHIFPLLGVFSLDVDFPQPPTLLLKLKEMQQGLLVFYIFQVENKFDLVGRSISVVDEPAEVEDEVEEVVHFVSQDIVADVLSVLVLLVKNTYPQLHAFAIFGDQDSDCAVCLHIYPQTGVPVEVLQFKRGQLKQLLEVVVQFVLVQVLLVD